jgi:hypothetical protein
VISGIIEGAFKPGEEMNLQDFGVILSGALKRQLESREVLGIRNAMIKDGSLVKDADSKLLRRVVRLP